MLMHFRNRSGDIMMRDWYICSIIAVLFTVLLSAQPLYCQNTGTSEHRSTTLDKDSLAALCKLAREIAERDVHSRTTSNMSKAIRAAENALQLAARIKSKKDIALTSGSMGYIYEKYARWPEAIHWYQKAYLHFELLQDQEGMARSMHNLAKIHLYSFDLKSALKYYQKALQLSISVNDAYLHARVAFGIAAIHQNEGRRTEAVHWYRTGAEIANDASECICEASCRNNMGAIFSSQGKYDSALIQYRRALSIAEKSGNAPRVLQYKLNIAVTQQEMGTLKHPEKVYEEIFSDAAQLDHTKTMFEARMEYASLFAGIGKYPEAIRTYNECLGFVTRTPKSIPYRARAHILCYNALGDVYLSMHRYSDALKYYRLAGEEQHWTKGLEAPVPMMLINTGKVYSRMHRFEDAKDAFRQGMDHFREVTETIRLANAMLHLGDVLVLEDSSETAMEWFRNVLDIGTNINNPLITTQAQLRISRLLQEKGDLFHARPHILETMRQLGNLDNVRERCETMCLYASVLIEDGKYDSALAMLNTAEATVKPGSAADLIPGILHRRESLALHRGDLREAYDLQERRVSIQDSLSRIQQDARFEHLLIEYETEKKEHEIVQLKNNQALQHSRLKRETLLRNFIIGGAILLIIIGLLILRRMRDRRRTVELRAQAAEATALSAETEKLRVLAEAERREKETQQLFSRQLLNAQEEERKRIAGELHDSLSQDLIVVKNRLLLLRETTGLNGDLNDAIEGVGETLDDVRRLSRDLRPSQLDRYGIRKALRSLVRRVNDSTSVNVTFEIGDVDGLWNKDAEASIYRIVQEGINNILRHAEAENARISLMPDTDTAVLSIEDDGKGLPVLQGTPEQSTNEGFGHRNMKERASIMGGTMNLSSQPDQGTRIEIVLPLSDANRKPDVSMQKEMEHS